MFHKKISNVLFVSVMVLVLVGVAQATPIVGTFDSRTPGSTIVADVPSDGEPDSSFWEDCTDTIGMFDVWGAANDVTQWYVEAQDPDWNGGWNGYIQLNSFGNAPWFGDDPAAVGGYEGQITGWTVNQAYTGEVLDLVLTGTAVLDKKHLMPWYDWGYEDMSPVSISFEMGFNGVPDKNYIEPDKIHYTVSGAPDYFVVTVIPEPTVISLLVLGGLGFLHRRKS